MTEQPLQGSERAAIGWSETASDGLPSFGWDNARVQCKNCDGWTGLECPSGCGVRLVSTQAEDTARFREQMRVEEQERRERREASRAARKAR